MVDAAKLLYNLQSTFLEGYWRIPVFPQSLAVLSPVNFLLTMWVVCVCVLSRFSCEAPLYDPRDCSPPGSSVHEILQARIQGWVAMPSSRQSSQPTYRICVSCVFCIVGGFFTTEPPGKPELYGSQSGILFLFKNHIKTVTI